MDFIRSDNESSHIIDCSKLEPADIILTGNDSIPSVGIKLLYNSKYSHVSIHAGGGYVIEAVTSKGVHVTHVRKIMQEELTSLKILRPTLKSSTKEKVSQYAIKFIGETYGWRQIAAKAKILKPSERSKICSELVARSFSEAHANFFGKKKAADVVPKDFENSPDFTDVTQELIRKMKVSQSEVLIPLNEISIIQHCDFIGHRQLEDDILNSIITETNRIKNWRTPNSFIGFFKQLELSSYDNREACEQLDKHFDMLTMEYQESLFLNVTPNGMLGELGLDGLFNYVYEKIYHNGIIGMIDLKNNDVKEELELFYKDAVLGQRWLKTYNQSLRNYFTDLEEALPQYAFPKIMTQWIGHNIEMNEQIIAGIYDLFPKTIID
ncbi:YiiX/YebB-like N1pC/P60 family cysteine hydrolase [Thalassotalea litorea]|nr:YiiX/YebB-like N1pC/P60 family cysteine hydrolase [Thalassotalea litorea]